MEQNRAAIVQTAESNPDFIYGQEYKNMVNEQRLTELKKEIVDTRLEQAGLSSRNVAVIPITAAGGGVQQAPMTAWERVRSSWLRPTSAPYMTRSTRQKQRELLAENVRDLSGQIEYARVMGDVQRVEELESQRLVSEKKLGILREKELSAASEQKLGVLSAWAPRSAIRSTALAQEKRELERDIMDKERALQEGALNINNFSLTPEAKDLRYQITLDRLDLEKINAELRGDE